METKHLIKLLKDGVSPFAVVEAAKGRLFQNGFQKLDYASSWKLMPGGHYFVEHHGSTLFAFTIGEDYQNGDMLRMAAAHTDFPCLRIKPNADFQTDAYAQVNVEVYGGAILNTWLDRPLGIAGRVAVRSEEIFAPKILYYRSARPLLTIPNLAIHMNQEVNKGIELNPQIDLMPIFSLLPEKAEKSDVLLEFLAKELSVKKEDILDFELCSFLTEEPELIGMDDSMLSSPRLDNLTSVSVLLSALLDGNRQRGINLIALFDHEEIGSRSKQGAGSILLHDMIRRILRNLGADEEQIERCIYQAMLLSVDVAHGLHPNKQSKMDITNHPVLGRGFCIKEACSQSYATDAQAVAILRQICDRTGIPYQHFVNRSDLRGGGTLGSVASALLPVKTVDMGVPILAMHSARELMGTQDIYALKDAIMAFFTS